MEFKEIIKAHLDKMAQQDAAFAARYNMKGKTLDNCIKYIFSEAQKKRTGNCAAIEDAVVFGWAVHYYQEDNLKIDDVKAEVKHSGGKNAKADTPKPQPIRALVNDKEEKGKCKQLDLFTGF